MSEPLMSTKDDLSAMAPGVSTALPTKPKDGRSRVYIACTHCRQRKIKCGGEQPACRNCSRADLDCHYDAEPKRRGPDKRPGTRVRTRKDTNGAVISPAPRASATRPPGLSDEPPLVPSQAGPTRNKKRLARGLSLEQTLRSSFSDDPAPPSPNDTTRMTIFKIAPPAYSYELENAAPTNALGHIPTGYPPQDTLEAVSETPQDHVSSNVRLPYLPTFAARGFSDHPKPSVSGAYGDDLDRVPYDAYGQLQRDDKVDSSLVAYPTPSPSLPSTSGSHTDRSFITNALTDGSLSSYAASSPDSAFASNDHSPGMPTNQSRSPAFTRLQHTHDPHFHPPKDMLAGLTYPRAGMVVPALDRGAPPLSHDMQRNNADNISGTTGASDGLGVDLGQTSLGDISQATGLVGSDPEGISGEGLYAAPIDPQFYANLNAGGSQHQSSDEHAYRNYVATTGHRYRSSSTSSHSTQPDIYLPPSGSSYTASVDSYDDYRSSVPMPTEVTFLSPPVGDLISSWSKDVDGLSLYDDSAESTNGGSTAYYSGTVMPWNDYDDLTSIDSDAQSQTDDSLLPRHRYRNDVTRRMLYKSATSWIPEPSTAFVRKTWWDSLLEMYAPTKAEAAQLVTSDLKYLFKTSNYWLSFMNISLFMTNYNHRDRREAIQPSVILAALAYSAFTQSSEIEKGCVGRARAMELRNHAQAALEASVNSQRLDPTLAHAAFLLALFEISAHPEHSTERARSSLRFLDSIIRLLGLTTLDVMDSNVKVFSPDQVPRLPLSPNTAGALRQRSPTTHDGMPGSATCSCQALSIASTTTHAQMTPFWGSSPGWDLNWTEAEIRLEESRRLVWCTLAVASGFTAHDAAFAKDPTELHLIHASNYALHFPGEVMMRGIPSAVHSPQENVWALYARAMLLWNSCLSLRKKAPIMTDHQLAEFAVNTWLETNTIEEAFNRHTCGFERNTLFQGREYLFNTRMFISWEFRRYIPSPDTGVHQQFHRRKAEEWLEHQAEVAKRLMQGLHTVTGMTSSVLGKRPYFVWWFMSQVSRCLSLWQCDQSLLIALEVARAFLPPIDYLTCLWPCPAQRSRYSEIRRRLHDECIKHGLEPPPPPQLVIPTAVL